MTAKYRVIAHAFSFNGAGACPGRAIASAEALYLVPGTHDLNKKKSATFLHGGAFGLGMALGRLAANEAVDYYWGTFFKEMEDLESLMSAEADWPIRSNVRGFVCRRDDTSIRYPWWGALEIVERERKFIVKPAFFNRGRVLKKLRNWGWTI